MTQQQHHQFLPQKVKAVLAVDQNQVRHNIKTNMENIPTWLDTTFYPNGYEAIILSAGPSLEKYVEELNLKERMKNPNRGFIVFCVKHAYPRLMDMGIEPDICVMLDGRPFNESSTHGITRKELFKKVSNKTVFMVASMSHPDYATHLMDNGGRVLGWHTSVQGIEEFNIQTPIVSGGTSSGTRCISIANLFGIRDVTLVGFDSCIHDYDEEKSKEMDSKGRPKYIYTDLPLLPPKPTPEEEQMHQDIHDHYAEKGLVFNGSLAKRFWTTGELLAQAQDFETVFTDTGLDMRFRVLDDGIVSHMFNNIHNVAKRGYSFIDYISQKCPRRYRQEDIPKSVDVEL